MSLRTGNWEDKLVRDTPQNESSELFDDELILACMMERKEDFRYHYNKYKIIVFNIEIFLSIVLLIRSSVPLLNSSLCIGGNTAENIGIMLEVTLTYKTEEKLLLIINHRLYNN